MSGRVAGNVAFVTGAGRGQGRSHALRPAEEGALKAAVDEGVAQLGKLDIRVNTVHPTGVDTPMGTGLGGLEALITKDPNVGGIFVNTLPVEITQPRDISNAVLFLASEEAQYVTGLEFTIDAGNTIR